MQAEAQSASSSNPQRFLVWAKSLVKERRGALLSRGMILKTGALPFVL